MDKHYDVHFHELVKKSDAGSDSKKLVNSIIFTVGLKPALGFEIIMPVMEKEHASLRDFEEESLEYRIAIASAIEQLQNVLAICEQHAAQLHERLKTTEAFSAGVPGMAFKRLESDHAAGWSGQLGYIENTTVVSLTPYEFNKPTIN